MWLLKQMASSLSADRSPKSASLRMSVRIVSSKQVFPPGDEEEGEILYNLRIDVGRNPQPCVNREMHPLQGSDCSSIGSRERQTRSIQNPPVPSLGADRPG